MRIKLICQGYIYPTPEYLFHVLDKLSYTRMQRVQGLISSLDYLKIIADKKIPLSEIEESSQYMYHHWIHDVVNHLSIYMFPVEWIDYVALRAEKTLELIKILQDLNASPYLIDFIIERTASIIDVSQATLGYSLPFVGEQHPDVLMRLYAYLTGIVLSSDFDGKWFERSFFDVFTLTADQYFLVLPSVCRLKIEDDKKIKNEDFDLLDKAVSILLQRNPDLSNHSLTVTLDTVSGLFEREGRRFHQELVEYLPDALHNSLVPPENQVKVEETELHLEDLNHQERSWLHEFLTDYCQTRYCPIWLSSLPSRFIVLITSLIHS